MLYNGSDAFGTYEIGAATSVDGDSWTTESTNPVLGPGPIGSWDASFVVDPSVIWDGTQWVMYYAGHDGSTFAIGRATSDDLIAWTKDPANPILSGGSRFVRGANFPSAVFDAATGTTSLWYTGWSIGDVVTIGFATIDATGAVDDFGEILSRGVEGEFDDEGLVVGTVIEVESGWRVYYTGQSGPASSPDYRTGYATCAIPPSGSTCRKGGVIGSFAGPILLSGVTYRSNQLRSMIRTDDGSYSGFGTAFHSGDWTEVTFGATSPDGIAFDTPTGPVLPLRPGEWDSRSAENPSVVSISP